MKFPKKLKKNSLWLGDAVVGERSGDDFLLHINNEVLYKEALGDIRDGDTIPSLTYRQYLQSKTQTVRRPPAGVEHLRQFKNPGLGRELVSSIGGDEGETLRCTPPVRLLPLLNSPSLFDEVGI